MGRKWLVKLLQALVAILCGVGKASEVSWEFVALSLDCGATRINNPNKTLWRLEDGFIETGQKKLLSLSKVPDEMGTLRFFPDGHENCYHLPLTMPGKYLLRAGFYYGNYDGLSNPPTFELRFDGHFWANVSASLREEPIYVEAIYPVNRRPLSVCLVQTRAGEVPFISSLEATNLPHDLYRLTDSNTAFQLWSRSQFGGEADIGRPSVKDQEEMYNRVWKLKKMPNYTVIPWGGEDEPNSSECENLPPSEAVENAITPPRGRWDPIIMSIDFPERTEFSAYFVLYFMEPLYPWPYSHRKFRIYIDGYAKITREVSHKHTCQVVTLYPVRVVGPASITILPVYGSTDPPIINAMEVFTALKLSKDGEAPSCSSLFLFLLHVLVGLIISG